MLRRFVLLTLIVLCSCIYLPAQGTASLQGDVAEPVLIMADRDMGGGFWQVDGTLTSVLHLKNILESSPITVRPVIWMADGTEYNLSPISLDPAGTAAIDIKYALRDAPPDIAAHASTVGSIGIRYQWQWNDAVIAFVTSMDEFNSVSFTTHLSANLSKTTSIRQEPSPNLFDGFWWLQTPTVRPFVSLVNTTSTPLSAHLSISDDQNQHSTTQEMVLAPHGSQLVQLDELIRNLPSRPEFGGLQISYAGVLGSLSVEGGLQDLTAGYSAPIPMLSLNARRMRSLVSMRNTTLAAVGVQLGVPEAKMDFPQNTKFVPYAYIRNLTAQTLHVRLGMSFMSTGPKQASLGLIDLLPQQSLKLDLQARINQAGFGRYSGEANFTFGFTGPADDMLIAIGSSTTDYNYVFSVDPIILIPEAGKIICNWQVSGATDTMISLWNSGSIAEDADLMLFFRGGHYRYSVHLKANESQAINIGSLIHRGEPDADGNVIPGNITEGSARLVNPLGRRQVFDVKTHAAIFNVETATCYEVCNSCSNIVQVLVDPSSAISLVESNLPAHMTATDNTGASFDVTQQAIWSSNNSGIATVSSAGVIGGMNVGSTSISSSYTDTGVPSWNEDGLCSYPLPQCPRFQRVVSTPVYVYQPVDATHLITLGISNLTSKCNQKFVQVIPNYSTNVFFSSLLSTQVLQYPNISGLIPPHVSGATSDTEITLPGAPIRLFPNFYPLDQTTQSFILIHEGIHHYTLWNDPEIFTNFAPYGLMHINPGTADITDWIQKGCQP